VADDQTTPPAPRPRRRRTDIDPYAPSPPVANERRRRRKSAEDSTQTAPPAAALPLAPLVMQGTPPPPVTDATPGDATAPFHVPGLVAAAVVAPPSVPDRSPVDVDPGRAWLSRLDDRSLDPNTCPFLRAAADGALVVPIERPDPANRCAALAEAVPQSLRQQELVCLVSGHVNCPRYLRGAAVVETPTPVVRTGRTLTTPVFASLVLLVMAVSASAAFAFARGGIGLTAALPSPSATAVAVAVTPSPAAAVPTPSASASPTPSLAITPSPSASLSPQTPAPATPKPTPAPTPKSDRYKLLRACPGTPRCWIYRVRSGDNLYSIAKYFGVSQSSIYARNPSLKNSGLRAGQELRLPPPTR
jgi:hypothetical protein